MIDYKFGARLGPITDISPSTIMDWRNNPEIYQWCRQREPLNQHAHLDWYHGLHNRQDVKMYAIREIVSAEAVGICGLTSIDLVNRHAEFSLYIAPERQRLGYGAEALKTLCAHGFLGLGLKHIFGETFDQNPAAQMFESVGFVKEGTRRKFYYRQGQFIDAHLYSILDEDFRGKWNI